MTPPYRWFRFSLRTLFALVALAAVCLIIARLGNADDENPLWPLGAGVLFWGCLVLIMLRARRREQR